MKHRLASLAVIAFILNPSASALSASTCAKPAELKAENVRILQTELMVAALKCRNQSDLNMRQKYNAFVERFTPQLVRHSETLTTYFKRQYGSSYRGHMDSYITGLANTVSLASDDDPAFCRNVSTRAETILDAGTDEVTVANFKPATSDAGRLEGCDTVPEKDRPDVQAAQSQ